MLHAGNNARQWSTKKNILSQVEETNSNVEERKSNEMTKFKTLNAMWCKYRFVHIKAMSHVQNLYNQLTSACWLRFQTTTLGYSCFRVSVKNCLLSVTSDVTLSVSAYQLLHSAPTGTQCLNRT